MERAYSVQRRLRTLTGPNQHDFLENMCTNFIANGDKDPIHDVIISLSKLQKRIYKYQNKVYELSGVSDKFKEVDDLVLEVKTVVDWVEELFCQAMVDKECVVTYHTSRAFGYQK